MFNDDNGTETSLMPGANAGHTLNIQPVHALVQHCCLHSPRSLHESAWVCLSREPALSCWCRLHWLKAQQQTEKAWTAGTRNQSINARSRRKMMILCRGRDSEYVVLKWSNYVPIKVNVNVHYMTVYILRMRTRCIPIIHFIQQRDSRKSFFQYIIANIDEHTFKQSDNNIFSLWM